MTIVGTLGVLVGTFLDKIFCCKTSGKAKKGNLGLSMVTMKKALFTKVLIIFLFIGVTTGGIIGQK